MEQPALTADRDVAALVTGIIAKDDKAIWTILDLIETPWVTLVHACHAIAEVIEINAKHLDMEPLEYWQGATTRWERSQFSE